ncbi:MAG: inorganic diphosphatase [Acidimicrobiia bacterium]
MSTDVVAVVEIPKGSRNKYEMDAATGRIFLDRMLFTATRYPADYGFVEGTAAEDGDPLDVLILVGEPTFPGCRIEVRPIGVFLMEDSGLRDHKVISVPAGDPRWADIVDIEDLDVHLRRELEHFFEVYKALEDKKTAALGWQGVAEARDIIDAAREAFREAE